MPAVSKVLLIATLCGGLTLPPAFGQDPSGFTQTGDVNYNARADGHRDDQAAPEPIERAIEAYRQALDQDPKDVEASWKLLRAISFKGDYVISNTKQKQAVFQEGKNTADKTLKLLEELAKQSSQVNIRRLPLEQQAELYKKIPGATPTFFWTSALWGQWALAFGKLAAARQGAAAKIRDYAMLAILTDDQFEGGGGYRVLGRLHHQSPHIPLITGWVSRKEALINLEKAYKMAPDYKFNAVYYAEALHDYDQTKRAKAIEILKSAISTPPSPDRVVEDLRLQKTAQSDLESWK